MIRSIFSLSCAAIYSNISDYPTYHDIISIKKSYNKSATVNVHYNIPPIKENKVACLRLMVLVLPLPFALGPVHALRAEGEFRHNSSLQIAPLVGTPRCEAGAPFHMPTKAVPAPIRLTSLVAKLCQSHFYDSLIATACKRPTVWVVPQHMGRILRVAYRHTNIRGNQCLSPCDNRLGRPFCCGPDGFFRISGGYIYRPLSLLSGLYQRVCRRLGRFGLDRRGSNSGTACSPLYFLQAVLSHCTHGVLFYLVSALFSALWLYSSSLP